MNSIDEDLKLKIISGKPILLQNSNCFFQHRTLEEIIDFGFTKFLKIIQLFNFSDKELEENFDFPINNFIYFLLNISNGTSLSSLIEDGFYFFLGINNLKSNLEEKKILCSYKEIDNIEITKEGFDEIIKYINIIYEGNKEKEEEEDDSNLSEAERRMKEKFRKKKIEREKAKSKKEGATYFSDLIGGFWSKNYNMTFYQILKLPYYTFYFLLEKLKNTDNYEFQLRAMLAGADMKDKPLHHWLEGHTDDDTD